MIIEMLNKIPDAIGWTMVAILGVACAVMMYKLGKIFVEMWKDWHEEDEEGEE